VRLSDRKRFTVRLYGIMTPDITQLMGRKAKRLLASLAMGKTVMVDEKGEDHLGRTEGIVHIHQTTVNEQMIRSGMAWVDPLRCRTGECDPWKHQEVAARITKKGLWEAVQSENPQFEWHKKNVPPAEQAAPPAQKTYPGY